MNSKVNVYWSADQKGAWSSVLTGHLQGQDIKHSTPGGQSGGQRALGDCALTLLQAAYSSALPPHGNGFYTCSLKSAQHFH